MSRMKKILCNYEFNYQGSRYMSNGFYLGDTANPKAATNKDYTPFIVCQSLKITNEQLGLLLKCKYWDISRDRLAKAGITFTKLDIYFYPNR